MSMKIDTKYLRPIVREVLGMRELQGVEREHFRQAVAAYALRAIGISDAQIAQVFDRTAPAIRYVAEQMAARAKTHHSVGVYCDRIIAELREKLSRFDLDSHSEENE